MPIKPENKHRYPKNWKAIRDAIVERADYCCEVCGALNHSIGYREPDGKFVELPGMQAETAALDGIKTVQIVLTVAHHPDPSPENCDEANLLALCQRCHNRLDGPMRAKNAAATRREKRAKHQPALAGFDAMPTPAPAAAGETR